MYPRCVVCEHQQHDGTCGVFEDGGPLFMSNKCKCTINVHLDEIDEALYKIDQSLTWLGHHHLRVLAKALGRTIPKLPSRAEASVKGATTRSRNNV